jgi:hypothetical protein
MKKEISSATALALSLFLSGCASSDTLEVTNKFSLLDACIDSISKDYAQNNELNITDVSIKTNSPNQDQITQYADLIKKNLSNPDDLEKFSAYLNKNPLLVSATIHVKAKDKYSCSFMYGIDNSGKLKKLPYLYQIQENDTKTIIKNQYVKPITMIQYLMGNIIPNHGIRYFNLSDDNSLAIQQIDKDSAATVLNLLSISKSNQEPEFQQLVEPTLPMDSMQVAQQALVGVKFPEVVNENPIYVTPVVVNKKLTMINDYTPNDRALAKMEEFNKNRYVDPNTGIALHNETLNELKNEYQQKNQGNIIYEQIDSNGQSINASPDGLRLNDSQFVESDMDN